MDHPIAVLCNVMNENKRMIASLRVKKSGLSDAHNAVLANANGVYMLFIDLYEWISINMLEKMLFVMKVFHVDLVICQFVEVYPNDKLKRFAFKNIGTKILSPQATIKILLKDVLITNHVSRTFYKEN